VAAASLLAGPQLPARGGTVSWINSLGGSWSDATNWNPQTVPVGGDVVSIHTMFLNAITITFIGDYTASNALASLDLSSQRPSDLTITQPGLDNPLYVGTETIGDSGGHATFSQNINQQHTITGDFTLGNGGTGIYNLNSGIFTEGGNEIIGGSGHGTFTQGGGINTQTGTGLWLGYATGGSGVYLLNGGTLSAALSEYVGYVGTGSFTQSGGTSNAVNGALANGLYLGYNAGATGSYLLSSGTLAVASNEDIGVSGTGAVTQNGGSNTMISLYLGVNGPGSGFASAIGSYTLSGGTLSETGGSGFSYEMVGYFGNGTFTQHGGANLAGSTANPTNLYVGYFDGSAGIYSMDAATATPTLIVSGSEYLGTAANGGFGGAIGTFNQSAGTHSVGGSLYVGDGAGASGSFTLSGTGQLSVAGTEYVGYNGAGSFTQQGGTNSAAVGVTIAANAGSSGSYTLAGGTLSAPLITNHGTFNQPSGGGTLAVSGSFTNAGNATFAGTQQWSAGSSFTNTAGTAAFQSDAGGATASFNLTVNDSGGSVAFTGPQHVAALNLSGSGQANITSAASSASPGVLDVSALSFIGTTAQLDLNNNELIAPGTADTAESLIVGGQIISTAGTADLGYITLDVSHFEIRWTLLGDTNLDGMVNVADLANLAGNFGVTTGATWIEGDFDRNGNVNVADLADLAGNFGNSLAGIGGGASESFTDSSTAVPEPSGLSLLLSLTAATRVRPKRVSRAR
jgi:hypothetical protein